MRACVRVCRGAAARALTANPTHTHKITESGETAARNGGRNTGETYDGREGNRNETGRESFFFLFQEGVCAPNGPRGIDTALVSPTVTCVWFSSGVCVFVVCVSCVCCVLCLAVNFV